jgi:hypothetical protein
MARAAQIGLIGALPLDLPLFGNQQLAAWRGAAMVAETSSWVFLIFCQFEFLRGWVYVFGVGVLGGTMLRLRTDEAAWLAPMGGVGVRGGSCRWVYW